MWHVSFKKWHTFKILGQLEEGVQLHAHCALAYVLMFIHLNVVIKMPPPRKKDHEEIWVVCVYRM